MTDHIPPLQPPDDLPPVRTQADLHRLWRALMGPLGFAGPSLWFQLLDPDGRTDGVLTELADRPTCPERTMLDQLMLVCRHVAEPGDRVAFLLTRPGSRHVTDDDRAWARGLLAAAHDAGVRCEPIHLANDEEVRVLAPDDLGVPGNAA